MLFRPNSRKRGAASAVLALCLLAAGSPAGAQQNVVTTTAVPPTTPANVEVRENAVQLSLEQAVQIALQHNLGLVAERYTRAQRRLSITQNLGIYDLLSLANVSATDRQSAVVDATQASSANSQNLGFSFQQLIPTGGTVEVGVDGNRFESNAQTRQAGVSYGSGLDFSFTQPLLRNFGRLATEQNIIVARTNSRISRQEFERQVTLTIQQVVDAYWNLVGSREQLRVARQSLDLARQLHERNRIQVEVGTLAPLELVQSEAAIATNEENIIRNTSSVGDAEDELRRLLNLPPGPLWQTPITPTTDPDLQERLNPNLDEAILTAYAERPELRTLELQLDQSRFDAELQRNRLRPDLNLVIEYDFDGLDLDGVGGAYSSLFGLDFPFWSASLNFSYPIQNRSARAASAIANLDVERVRTQVEDQRAIISTEVRRAVRAVQTAAQQIEAARASRQFQERNLEAQQKRYENGMSTSFEITQVQEDLAQALSREVTARIQYRTALTEYYRATGRLLEQQNVAIDDPEEADYASRRFRLRREPLPGEKLDVGASPFEADSGTTNSTTTEPQR
ncbi:MAG TPA: TolC family protein [Thermoanaerobaculia bacterium]